MLKLEALKNGLPQQEEALEKLGGSLDVGGLREKIADLNLEVEVPGFWDDIDKAQGRMKLKKQLENELSEYDGLAAMLEEARLMIDMSADAESGGLTEEAEELADEAEQTLKEFDDRAEKLRIRTLLTEEYDDTNVILSIHPGTGGLDAQDWAEMLLRMYTRWCDSKGFSVKVMDYQRDTEGGIKSVTVFITGEFAYGYLKTERGVHRLVRISPFNTMAKRQTSFASVDVTPELPEDIKVEIAPEDLRIDTYRSSGAGGQHVNKTDSAVRITHLPTNIVVTCQNERSQGLNKEFAMRVLYSKLLALAKQEHLDKISELKGNFGQISWGNQIRSYVFQPYTMVKDHRTGAETSNVQAVMDGDIDMFINASLNALRNGEL
ncbi:MAG: peptide chain release factor 2 [Firmicutes bacterium]|nr:peptide chain release factor 2 [Bacillota bacterium]